MADSDYSEDESWGFDSFDESDKIEEKLTADIESVQELFGESSIEVDAVDATCSQVDLHVCVDLDIHTATRWGINPNKPIVVRLHINPATYGDDPEITVKNVYQPPRMRQFANSKQIMQITETFIKTSIQQKPSSSLPEQQPLSGMMAGLELEPANGDVAAAKAVPAADYGLLAQIVMYLQQRVPTMHRFCVLCDQVNYISATGFARSPRVCARPVCRQITQTLRAEENQDTLKFMIAMATRACQSERSKDLFHPSPATFAQTSSSYQNISRMLLEMLNSQNEITDPQIVDIRAWIEKFNTVQKLHQSHELGFMGAKHQFVIQGDTAQKNDAFEAARAIHGTKFAFHGSRTENWWSIMNNGLKIMSGTKFQMHGSVHGEGIYLSPVAKKASRYARSKLSQGTIEMYQRLRSQKGERTSQKETRSRSGRVQGIMSGSSQQTPVGSKNQATETPSQGLLGVWCLALCEVIDDSSVIRIQEKDGSKSEQTWVVTNPDNLRVCMVFAYEGDMGGDDGCISNDINSQSKSVADIENVLKMYC